MNEDIPEEARSLEKLSGVPGRKGWVVVLGDFLERFKRVGIAMSLIAIFAWTMVTHYDSGIQVMSGIVGAVVGFYFVSHDK